MPRTKTTEKPPTKAALAALRKSLDAKRLEMLNFYEHDMRVGQESTDDNADDFADRANNSYNRELMFTLSDAERATLIRVDEAIDRMEKGEYGICVHCGEPIGQRRLEAVPWAHHCIRCQEREEMGTLED